MLTILTTPKPQTPKANMDFANAMRNWSKLIPTPEIFVFDGERDRVELHGGIYINDFPATDLGLPYMDEMFAIARRRAANNVFMLVSDHLMFLPGLMKAIARVQNKFDTFLAVGQRHDINIEKFVDFHNSSWPMELQLFANAGRLHGPSAKDYMVISRDYPLALPPFIVGRPWYDSWFVVAALEANIPVVDLTRTVTALHPNHDYYQIPGNPAGNHGNPGEKYNEKLAVGCAGKGHASTSTWVDTVDGIRRREELNG